MSLAILTRRQPATHSKVVSLDAANPPLSNHIGLSMLARLVQVLLVVFVSVVRARVDSVCKQAKTDFFRARVAYFNFRLLDFGP